MKLHYLSATILAAGLPLVAQVHVVASNGVRAVMEELGTMSSKVAGAPVQIQYDTSSAIKQKIDAGGAFDVAILTTDLMDELLKDGKISPIAHANIGRSGIGVGIQARAKAPDIRTADSFKKALLNAKAITYAQDGASRVSIEKMFQRMGITEAMKAKTLLEQGSTRANQRVADGDAEMVITLVSEIMPAKGLELVGPIPADFQKYVAFAAGVSSSSKNAEAAGTLVKFLSGPQLGGLLKSKGMEPPR